MPKRAAEIALLRRDDDAMVFGQLLERVAGDAVDAGIADMKQMRGRGLDDHRAEGADVALVFVVEELASPGLGVQPGVRRRQHALRRRLHRPGFRGAVVVGQKAFDGGLAGDLADVAAADAVGQDDGDALHAEQRLFRNQDAVKILIGLLATLIGMLPDRYSQFARHRRRQRKGPHLDRARPFDLTSDQAARRAAARPRASAPS